LLARETHPSKGMAAVLMSLSLCKGLSIRANVDERRWLVQEF
jgi:hypothetical protein